MGRAHARDRVADRDAVLSVAGTWIVPSALAGLCITLQALHLAPALQWQRHLIETGQWWRLLTGNFIHLGWPHLLMDLVGLALIWLLVGEALKPWQWVGALLVSSLGVGLGLYFFAPSISWYLGLSGALHGLYVAGAAARCRTHPIESIILILLIIAKLAWEALLGPLPGSDYLSGGQVVTQGHLFGALAGLAFALAYLAFDKNADQGSNGITNSPLRQ